MKNGNLLIYIACIASIYLISCAQKPLVGIVTYKEYDKAHASTNQYKKEYVSIDTVKTVMSFPARNGKVGNIWVKPKFKIWVANKNKIKTFKTDSVTWSTIKCGQLISYDPLSKRMKE